jgi:hypothetical protein
MSDAHRDMLSLFLTKNFLFSSSLCHEFVSSQWSVVSSDRGLQLTTDH